MKMMNEMIEKADSLSTMLDQSANDERLFNLELQIILEQMSWETYKMANDLRQIVNYLT